jgi:vacuolar-type H+-ATPase subunit E/Vma4
VCCAQALIRLNEPSCSLVCRKEDLATVKSVAPNAAKTFHAKAQASGLAHMKEVGTKGCKVTVNETTFLPPDPATVASPDLPSCCGGVVVLNGNNTISCANTLDARLDIAFEEQLPVIREKIFGDMVLGQI